MRRVAAPIRAAMPCAALTVPSISTVPLWGPFVRVWKTNRDGFGMLFWYVDGFGDGFSIWGWFWGCFFDLGMVLGMAFRSGDGFLAPNNPQTGLSCPHLPLAELTFSGPP